MVTLLKPGDAWDYPWRRMPAILRDNTLLFIVLFACGVVWTTLSATPQSFHTVHIEWIAGIAALGAALRGLQPAYRMRPSTIGWILAFYLSAFLLVSLLIGLPPMLLLFAHQYTLAAAWLLTLIPLIWIGVKLLATPAFFVLHESEGGTISSAMKLSWRRISGERWLQLFSIQFVIGLCCIFFVACLSLPFFFAVRGLLGVVLATCIYYAIALPAAAFSMTATFAVAASTEPAVLPADPVPDLNL